MWRPEKFVTVLILCVAAVSCYPESRVVGGTASNIEKYPFMVSLRGSSGTHSCGSSIIGSRWILTAAHCVDGSSPSKISIQYESTDIAVYSSKVVQVKRIIIHEDYNPYMSFANDIALLELVTELVFNYKTLAPVTLPAANFEIPQVSQGVPGVLAGWGLDKTGGSLQYELQEVDLKIYSDAECRSRHNWLVSTNHICGGEDEGGKGQCSGDSGGPLLLNGHIQLGIVSWSVKPCGVYAYPGVFTKVSHYIHWINKHIN